MIVGNVIVIALTLSLIVWHVGKMLDLGSLFSGWRAWCDKQQETSRFKLYRKLAEGWRCRLCLNTELALVVTLPVVGLLWYSYSGMMSETAWGLIAIGGWLVVAALAETWRKLE